MERHLPLPFRYLKSGFGLYCTSWRPQTLLCSGWTKDISSAGAARASETGEFQAAQKVLPFAYLQCGGGGA